jgi:uncharacterized protein (TIGR00661 family)
MKYIFAIQGEGRGHLTQAISLAEYLRAAGHEVAAVCVGCSGTRVLPKFFYDRIGAPVTEMFSPNFVFDKNRRGIRVRVSIVRNLLAGRKIISGLICLRRIIKYHQPDAVINFYEPLTGLLYGLSRPKAPLFCIGHQYLSLHPDFIFPDNAPAQKRAFQIFTRLTSIGAAKKFALSFNQLPNHPESGLFVVPPLLRPEIAALEPEHQDFLLVYLLNRGFSDDIIAWQTRHPGTKINVFWDNLALPDGYSPQAGLVFHHINDQLFLEKLRTCRAYASTAGFESICEAAYLHKPIMLVPTPHHFEQKCNAADAERCGLGIAREEFVLDDLLELSKNQLPDNRLFRAWVDSATAIFISHLAPKD